MADLIAERPHPLQGDRNRQSAVDLHGGVRLVFEPSQQPSPDHPHGGIDWRAVDDVTIVHVGDYHD